MSARQSSSRSNLGAFGARVLGRRVSARDDAGFTLVEVLVGLAILGLTIGGIFAATLTGLKTGSSTRGLARANALLSSFGESVKALPYTVCATPTIYQSAFEHADSQSDASGNAPILTATTGAAFEIVAVSDNAPGPRQCPSDDSGTQLVTLRVTVGGATRTGSIVKRTPFPEEAPPSINFRAEANTGLNAPFVGFRIIPVVSATGDVRVEYWCNPSWAELPATSVLERADVTNVLPATVITTPTLLAPGHVDDIDAGTLQCGPEVDPLDEAYGSGANPWQAPVGAPGGGNLRVIAMRITDGAGVTYPIVAKSVLVTNTTSGAGLPTADIEVMRTPKCSAQGQCVAPQTIQFNGYRSAPADGTSFVRCRWTFGPEAEPVVVTGSDCASEAKAVSYTFTGATAASGVNVTLTVYDNFGRSDPASVPIVLDGVVKKRPTIVVAATVNNVTTNEVYGSDGIAPQLRVESVAPQKVKFLATPTAYDGKTITKVEWSFGPAATALQSGSTPVEYRWDQASVNQLCAGGTVGHLAKVTVTDSDNLTNSKNVCVTLRPLGYSPTVTTPSSALDIRVVDRDIYIGFFTWRLEVKFRWTPILLPPGAVAADYRIQIETLNGNGALGCFLENGVKEFAMPITGDPTGMITFNAAFSTGSADGCDYRARVIRKYEGVDYPSEWTLRQPYNTAPLGTHFG